MQIIIKKINSITHSSLSRMFLFQTRLWLKKSCMKSSGILMQCPRNETVKAQAAENKDVSGKFYHSRRLGIVKLITNFFRWIIEFHFLNHKLCNALPWRIRIFRGHALVYDGYKKGENPLIDYPPLLHCSFISQLFRHLNSIGKAPWCSNLLV